MKAAFGVIGHLEARGVASALVGGVALGIHGIARATLDTDLLVVDRAVLRASFWHALSGLGPPEIRRGDAADPLAGVVRFANDAASVDVLVGKGAWMRAVVARRVAVQLRRRAVWVADRADLVLLKLFAGGPQDLLDVRLLLAADTGGLRDTVEQRLIEVPRTIGNTWRRLLARP